MGLVFRMTARAMSRCFIWNGARCSVKLLSFCGGPASSSATFMPASARRLHAQPPDAPEPRTMASKICLGYGGIAVARLPYFEEMAVALKAAPKTKVGGAALSGWSAVDEIAGAAYFLPSQVPCFSPSRDHTPSVSLPSA